MVYSVVGWFWSQLVKLFVFYVVLFISADYVQKFNLIWFYVIYAKLIMINTQCSSGSNKLNDLKDHNNHNNSTVSNNEDSEIGDFETLNWII